MKETKKKTECKHKYLIAGAERIGGYIVIICEKCGKLEKKEY